MDTKKRVYIEVTPEMRKQLKIMAAMRSVSLRSLVEKALVEVYPELAELVK